MVDEGLVCINCGEKVKSLYRKYSETVLKLTECEHCHDIADRYVEYDITLIIIDLILLRMMAYRHILHNTHFKFWKFSVMLILLETYSNWTLFGGGGGDGSNSTGFNATKPNLTDAYVLIDDLKFYKFCLYETFSKAITDGNWVGHGHVVQNETLSFVLVIYLLTVLYTAVTKKDVVSFHMMWKTVTVSSMGIFLVLPSLIWDITLQEHHVYIVALYTNLSQLIAFTAICRCAKIWSLFVIFSAYFCKTFVVNYVNNCYV